MSLFSDILYINRVNKNITSYPQNALHRSTNYITLFNSGSLVYNKRSFKTFYTTSKGNTIYKPHSANGMVGTSSAGYLARRRRV